MVVITQNGHSALMYAAEQGKIGAVVELIKAGVNLNLQSKVCHYTIWIHKYIFRLVVQFRVQHMTHDWTINEPCCIVL